MPTPDLEERFRCWLKLIGFIPDGRLLCDTTAPIVTERLRNQDTDAVVLTPS